MKKITGAFLILFLLNGCTEISEKQTQNQQVNVDRNNYELSESDEIVQVLKVYFPKKMRTRDAYLSTAVGGDCKTNHKGFNDIYKCFDEQSKKANDVFLSLDDKFAKTSCASKIEDSYFSLIVLADRELKEKLNWVEKNKKKFRQNTTFVQSIKLDDLEKFESISYVSTFEDAELLKCTNDHFVCRFPNIWCSADRVAFGIIGNYNSTYIPIYTRKECKVIVPGDFDPCKR